MFFPTNLALDAEHDVASADEYLVGHQSTKAADAETETTFAPDINEIAPDPVPQTEREARAGLRHIAYGALKPLVALITTQYVIVAALVAGAAVTVAHHGSQVINEKFAAIATALKRF